MFFSAATPKVFSQSILSFCKEKTTAIGQTRATERMDQYGGNRDFGSWFATIKIKDDKTHPKAASSFKKQACPSGQFAKTSKIITKQPSI